MSIQRRAVGGGLMIAFTFLASCIGPPLVIIPEQLPNAVEGVPYSQSLSTDDGALRWRIETGTLPPGLALDTETGLVAGRPTQTGVYDFTVRVDDVRLARRVGKQFYSITVVPKLALELTLGPGRVNESYESTPTITGGVSPYTVTVVGLPAGMDYDPADGTIFGTPLTAYSGVLVEMTVRDSGDPEQVAVVRATLTIHPPGVAIETSELDRATVGTEYRMVLEARDGKPPYVWRVTAGVLPAGLSLPLGTDAIVGTPTPTAVTRTFTLTVTDSDSPVSTDSREYKLVVPVVVSTSSLGAATVGTAYAATLGALAGVPPYTWELSAGKLPEGLQLAATGEISGTPVAGAQTETFTVRVSDSDEPATTAEKELTIEVGP